MKGRALLLGRLGAALLQDGALEAVALAAPKGQGPQPGAKYQAAVTRRLGQDAFLDLGGVSGFLPNAGDLKPGARLLVEVARPAEGRKAARVTQRLAFRGRLAALTPGAPGINLSRAVTDADLRKQVLGIGQSMLSAEDQSLGLILRTATARAPLPEIEAQIQALLADWSAARAAAAALGAAPGLVMAGPGSVEQALADWPRLEGAAILSSEAERATGLLRAAAPHLLDRLRIEAQDPIDRFDVPAMLDGLVAREVPLAVGRLVLDRTEALIAVDVDAGDADPTRVNMLAAPEIARQLRLRDWGGMVVVDFAGAPDPAARDRLQAALAKAADPDLKMLGWGPLGLLEGRRRRTRPPIEALWRRDDGETAA